MKPGVTAASRPATQAAACTRAERPGGVALVHGGAEAGDFLCSHAGVDEIHVTKPFSAELGNVSPVIVVPGPAGAWTGGEIAYHAENLRVISGTCFSS